MSCTETVVDFERNINVVWRDGDGEELPPPPKSAKDRREYASRAPRAHCVNGHPLAEADSIIVGFFGYGAAGKDSMIDMTRRLFAADTLRRHGVHAAIDGRDLDLWNRNRAEATAIATELDPYRAVTFRVARAGAHGPRQVLVFNTAGEQWTNADSNRIRRVHPFVPELDVIVIALPPEALPDLPESVRSPFVSGDEVRDWTLRGIQRLKDHITESGTLKSRRRMIILALTKCDRYAEVSSFPDTLLTARSPRSLAASLGDEQALIAKFIAENGGGRYFSEAAEIATPIFLAAISGTGPDDLDSREPSSVKGAEGAAPMPHSDYTRALDPLLYVFMREGMGDYE